MSSTKPTSNEAENGNKSKPLLGDVPFTDVDGKPIFIGNIIEQQNFNGQEYTARYEVCVDECDGEVCLFMISGNEKAMKTRGYSAFSNVVNGKLRKGQVVGHIA